MSSFGPKRKARVIKISDEPEEEPASTDGGMTGPGNPKVVFGSKASRKPFRQSGLRKPFNPRDGDEEPSDGLASRDEDDDTDGPVVVRPNISRAASSAQKKRATKSSKLSFGVGVEGDGDRDDTGSASNKGGLSRKVMENSAVKRGLATRGLPLRSMQDDEDRPRYSQEFLNELQSSTPNTPGNRSSLQGGSADEMELDASELEGALIVEAANATPSKSGTKILTDAEIREKKERRARLAKEQDFISLEDDDDNDDDDNDYMRRKKKDDTRLKPEDEDLGEGFDDYVEDGGLSLGKRAEKERSKRDRQQMADMINMAEGHSSDSSSDSDAERRMAYEAAQTRAGLDGLKKKPKKKPEQDLLQIPAKITPLPDLSECIAKLQTSLRSMEANLQVKAARLESLKTEKSEISTRQAEVQELLNETGKKYQGSMGRNAPIDSATMSSMGAGVELTGERGLESLGATPMRADEGGEPADV